MSMSMTPESRITELEALLARQSAHHQELLQQLETGQQILKQKNALLLDTLAELKKYKTMLKDRLEGADVVLLLRNSPMPGSGELGVAVECLFKNDAPNWNDLAQSPPAAQLCGKWLSELETHGKIHGAFGNAPAPFIKPRLVPVPPEAKKDGQ